MKEVFYSSDRGITKNSWLLSKHSFSFNNYQNKKRQKFGKLLVLNEDFVSPGKGFPEHSHENMEIISIVLSGKLRHQDSEENKGVLQAGEVQLMSAGSGIQHSEMNASKDHPVHFLQIWIEPASYDLESNYDVRIYEDNEFYNNLKLIASSSGEKNSLLIHQDAKLLLGKLATGTKHEYTTRQERGVYCHMIKGEAKINELIVKEGDAAILYDETLIEIHPSTDGHVLIIDVPFAE